MAGEALMDDHSGDLGHLDEVSNDLTDGHINRFTSGLFTSELTQKTVPIVNWDTF